MRLPDLLASKRGRMAAFFLLYMTEGIPLGFTAIVLLHNTFGATQDVAIDALAVNVLPESERGMANGFMFSGAYLGQAVGGSGVLFLTPIMGFHNTFMVVCAWIATTTLLVSVPLREPAPEPRTAGA